jgi:hypothetical protein
MECADFNIQRPAHKQQKSIQRQAWSSKDTCESLGYWRGCTTIMLLIRLLPMPFRANFRMPDD